MLSITSIFVVIKYVSVCLIFRIVTGNVGFCCLTLHLMGIIFIDSAFVIALPDFLQSFRI